MRYYLLLLSIIIQEVHAGREKWQFGVAFEARVTQRETTRRRSTVRWTCMSIMDGRDEYRSPMDILSVKVVFILLYVVVFLTCVIGELKPKQGWAGLTF